MNKAQELDTLRDLAAHFPEDSYMASLFSDGLYKWLENQMRDDLNCDIWATLAYTEDRAEKRVHEAMDETAKARMETHETKYLLKTLMDDNTRWQDETRQAREARDHYAEESAKLTRAYCQLQSDLAAVLRTIGLVKDAA